MGAKVWRRDGAGGTATATQHTTRGYHPAHPFPQGKRKLIWRRDTADSQRSEEPSAGLGQGAPAQPLEENGTRRGGGDEPAAKRSKTEQRQGPPMPGGDKTIPEMSSRWNAQEKHNEAAAGAGAAEGDGRTNPDVLLKRQAEREALKRKIEAQNKAVEDAKAKKEHEERSRASAYTKQQADLARHRRRMHISLAEALDEVKVEPGEKVVVNTADSQEVERVLSARTDYAVLQLQPGAPAIQIKKRYRSMAIALHPDKCKVENASDAFQRMVTAYQNLVKYAA